MSFSLSSRRRPARTATATRTPTTTTRTDGTFAFKRRFDRNMDLRAFAPTQTAVSEDDRAYVYPRPRSTFNVMLSSPAFVRLAITRSLFSTSTSWSS